MYYITKKDDPDHEALETVFDNGFGQIICDGNNVYMQETVIFDTCHVHQFNDKFRIGSELIVEKSEDLPTGQAGLFKVCAVNLQERTIAFGNLEDHSYLVVSLDFLEDHDDLFLPVGDEDE